MCGFEMANSPNKTAWWNLCSTTFWLQICQIHESFYFTVIMLPFKYQDLAEFHNKVTETITKLTENLQLSAFSFHTV